MPTACGRRAIRFLGVIVALAAIGPLAAGAEPRVLTFSPLGTVKQVRQVTAQFSEPMVPLGDPRPATGVFDIACPEPGAARWIDGRTWAYDLARDLPAGVLCTFRLRAGLATLDGAAVGGPREFAFSTGGPSVKRSIPFQGSHWIDEEQMFLLTLDAEPAEDTVLAHVAFLVAGLPQPVGVRIVAGADRAAVLKAASRTLPEGAPVLVIQARQRFPNGARVTLVWGRGVTSSSGVPTTEDQRLDYAVRPPFTVEFRCEREHRHAPCIPVTPMRVDFSAPVTWERARHITLVGPGSQRWTARARDEGVALHHGVLFPGPFPESASFRVELPGDLVDDAGRPPVNRSQFPLTVRTAAFPPLAKFASRFSIIEAKGGAALPVTLRRLEPAVTAALLRADRPVREGLGGRLADWTEQVRAALFRVPPESSADMVPWLRRVAAATRDRSVFRPDERARRTRSFTLPRPHGADAFEVVGIPLDRPGLYIVELESARLGASLLGTAAPMYVPAAALVTNLGVHLKWGAERSLVWVTTLDEGRPAPGVRVTVTDCTTKVLWRGDTDADGLARIPGLPAPDAAPNCGTRGAGSDPSQSRALHGLDSGLLVLAQTRGDMSFVHSSWMDGIEPWRFGLPSGAPRTPFAVHTVLDRALVRAGDTLHMKHVLRNPVLAGFAVTPAEDRPVKAIILHLGSTARYELPLAWDGAGIAETAWRVPPDAKLGGYQVEMVGRPTRSRWGGSWEPRGVSASFRVEEFRVPFMRASLRAPASPQVNVTEVPLDLAVQYLAGGPARRLPAVVRTQLEPRRIPPFDDFERFVFANGSVREGTTRSGVEDPEAADDEGPDPRPAPGKPVVHSRDALTLDDSGSGRVVVRKLPAARVPQELTAELEFRDPSGETQTVATRVPLWPAARLVGIRADGDVIRPEALSTAVAVADLAGRPVAGADVRVAVFQRTLFSHRKRLVGGFYAYEHVQETRKVGDLCRGRTGVAGILVCAGPAPVTGHLILEASAEDPAGNGTTAHHDVWVAGPEADWWFDVRDSDRMDLIPERRRYEPGETARVQVRMPFRDATALVTVEREGILDAFVRRLSSGEPTIDVPVTPGLAPNAFISVLAVRGRAGDVQPTALVDLGRPAFRLGLTEIRVGWRAHELKVTVTPERPVYRVRETARVRIAVRTPDGAAPPPGSEVALAAVDEGLLELAPNPSWDLLEAMMRRRGHGVSSATAHLHVIGKRHFGLKALPQGGGGGRQTTRELFDTLLAWKGRIRLDARGEATVDVPLNDSLTSFRVVAVATGGAGAFGTGAASIRSTQDVMILPGLAPLVREGDRFTAEVTVRNATERAMELTVAARVAGLTPAPEPRPVTLAAGEARTLGWELTAPVGAERLRWDIEAGERGGAMDRVTVEQRVTPAVPVRTYHATLQQWPGQRLEISVAPPAGALPGRGGLEVALRPRLADGLDGVRAWMARYPYHCLEQQVSQAVALGDPARWAQVVASLPAHLDGDGLLKYFPPMRAGDEILTAYVLSVSHAAGLALPGDLRDRMQSGLGRFVDGRLARRAWPPSPDLPLRKLAALEALARGGQVDAALVSSIAIEPNLWPTSGVIDWWGVLARTPALPDRAGRLAEAERIVRARLSMQGTLMGFASEASDRLWWLMVSGDLNAVRLVLHLLETGLWRDEVPRLVRGALARQQRGHWDLTLANAWGVVALERFSRAFEATPVAGVTTARLAGAERRLDWARAPVGDAMAFPWPPAVADLSVAHEGTGRPWVTLRARAALPLAAPVASGYTITRTLTPIERRTPGQWSRGDLLRVRLEIQAQADMTWVVVDDPIPAGASHVGRGLRREPVIAGGEPSPLGPAWPAFEERSFAAFRAYYRWVPRGPLAVEYTLRLNQSGRFALPPTRVEALYAPEMFGERPNEAIEVAP